MRDFAWATGAFRERADTTSTGVRIRVWYTPTAEADDVAGTLDIAKRAMVRFDDLFGRYPYPEVDVVLGPFAASAAWSTRRW